jgi:hypothetical protein
LFSLHKETEHKAVAIYNSTNVNYGISGARCKVTCKSFNQLIHIEIRKQIKHILQEKNEMKRSNSKGTITQQIEIRIELKNKGSANFRHHLEK